jgi:hypothetical protein
MGFQDPYCLGQALHALYAVYSGACALQWPSVPFLEHACGGQVLRLRSRYLASMVLKHIVGSQPKTSI